MEYFDDKQRKLIKSWHNLSENSEDYYMAFISEWIAFNAICYNLYFEKSIMERANIDRKKSKLSQIEKKLGQSINMSAEEAVIESKNNSWNLDIHFPDRLFLSISKIFTEDRIYDLFAIEYSKWYSESISENETYFQDIKESLKKNEENIERYYVINMARFKDFSFSKDIDSQANSNIIKLCESNDLQTIKNVLYQIRCNIFHGEKIPGDINDDRIVKSALPMLRFLVNKLIENNKI